VADTTLTKMISEIRTGARQVTADAVSVLNTPTVEDFLVYQARNYPRPDAGMLSRVKQFLGMPSQDRSLRLAHLKEKLEELHAQGRIRVGGLPIGSMGKDAPPSGQATGNEWLDNNPRIQQVQPERDLVRADVEDRNELWQWMGGKMILKDQERAPQASVDDRIAADTGSLISRMQQERDAVDDLTQELQPVERFSFGAGMDRNEMAAWGEFLQFTGPRPTRSFAPAGAFTEEPQVRSYGAPD
jgi:hypothetical protein